MNRLWNELTVLFASHGKAAWFERKQIVEVCTQITHANSTLRPPRKYITQKIHVLLSSLRDSKTISGFRSLNRKAFFKPNKMKKVTFLLCQSPVLASENVFLGLKTKLMLSLRCLVNFDLNLTGTPQYLFCGFTNVAARDQSFYK